MSENHKSEVSNPNISNNRPNLLKKYIIYVLIGGLIISSLTAIVSVLIGEFNTGIARTLFSTLAIVIHSMIGLWLLSVPFGKSLSANILFNALLVATVGSMLASILGIWEIVDMRNVINLYGVILFGFAAASIVSGLLANHLEDKIVKPLAYTSSALAGVTFLALIPWIFQDNNYELEQIYYRIVSALFILVATTSLLTVIFDRLHLAKHPEKSVSKPESMPFWVKLLIGLVVFLFGGWLFIPLIFGIFGGIFN